jgi:hypothetical protein
MECWSTKSTLLLYKTNNAKPTKISLKHQQSDGVPVPGPGHQVAPVEESVQQKDARHLVQEQTVVHPVIYSTPTHILFFKTTKN